MRSKIFTRTVGYWPLQESSGEALDYSGNENHASSTSVSSYGVSGPVGSSAMSFDGSSNYVGLPTFSLSRSSWFGWFKPTSLSSGDQTSWRHGGAHDFYLHWNPSGNNKLRWDVYDGSSYVSLNSDTVVENDKWYFVGLVDGASSVKMYMNGVVEDLASINLGGKNQSYSHMIGHDNGSLYWQGDIAHVRIWDYPLSEASIRALYNASRGGFSESDNKTL